MKKKIILALTACLFAAGSIINMHLAQNNHNTDISLADISVMAQADGENQYSEEIWWVAKHCNEPTPSISCLKDMGSETCLIADHCP